jgi:very-short-patch-repair endonuclease
MRRKDLRKNMTEAETILWSQLKGHQFGVKFRRQYGIGFYILDFYCPELKLAIEVDGNIHQTPEQASIDIERQECLEKIGLKFLRFTNTQIKSELNKVLLFIKQAVSVKI